MKYVFLILLMWCFNANAQIIKKADSSKITQKDTLVIDSGKKDSVKIFKPTIYDYQYQTQFSEKKIFDTVFTKEKNFVFSQYNNKDNFCKIQFANIGSGFQPLVFEVNPEKNLSLLPENKSFVILGIKDVKYYDVKTPTTSFIYHNASKNGADLLSTYTQNIGKNFNFALEYFGLRSQGAYRNSLAANNNTLFSAHYLSKNKHYQFFAHYLHQNVNNQEYGGISDLDVFLNGDSRFRNRQNLAVNLSSSNSQFAYRRYYFSQEYTPFNPEKYPFKIRHTFYQQINKYYYNQSAAEDFYYDAASDLVSGYAPVSKKYSKNFSNTVSLVFDKSNFKFDAGIRHQIIKLGVGTALTTSKVDIPSEVRENRLGVVGDLEIKLLDKILLNSSLEFSKGNQFNTFLRTENFLKFEPIKGYDISAKINFQSSAPSFNYLVNPSIYKKFNYYFEDPKNETVTEIGGILDTKWFKSQAFANYFRVDNYTYFNSSGLPEQSGSSLNISQVGGEATLDYGKFHLNPKLLFQTALTNKDLFPTPNFIGRVNIFYQTKAFRKAAEIQTGIKVYYFSKFASRDYFPILNEFILPDASAYSIGGQPIADAYFNMKVKRMFVFVEAQHFNTTFMQNKSFTAPYYPIYDFRLNLGVVWYLFN